MASRRLWYVAAIIALVCVGILVTVLYGPFSGASRRGAPLEDPRVIAEILEAYRAGEEYPRLEITYPFHETLFPPQIIAPTFRWKDEHAEADTWLVWIRFKDGQDGLSFLVGRKQWVPSDEQWEAIKRRSLETEAKVSVVGVNRARPQEILSAASIKISTSKDEVGAPIFYREVSLPFNLASKNPAKHIRWCFGVVSSKEKPRVVLKDIPTCANCHSFTPDGSTLAMEVDSASDKGSYIITPVAEEMVLDDSQIITWNDYRKEDGQKTFGLLPQISPDGKNVMCTVKDRSVFVTRPDIEFSQLFFPVKGVLVYYRRETGTFHALPGADDRQYVQANAVWSPDGKTIVFARREAYELKEGYDKKSLLLNPEDAQEFLEGGKLFPFNLYQIPFNDGKGGKAEPLGGASDNGMSNYFPKYSPDGKWIVFCRAKSFMLLQPDSELYIMPAGGGSARRMRCNTRRMNSWHSWSPNGKWLVFSSKANGPYTQLFLTHIDEQGRSTPPVFLENFSSPERAANIPEFVNVKPGAIKRIRERFLDDHSFVRAGNQFLRANDLDGAVRTYRKALEINPNSDEAHNSLAEVLLKKGITDQGIAHCRKALEINPRNYLAHYNLGNAKLHLGELDQAVEHYRKTLEIEPQDAPAHGNLGCALSRQGKFSEGIKHFEKALEINPRDATTHGNFANALFGQRKFEEAIGYYRKAVEIDPDIDPDHNNWGNALLRLGRFEEAIGHYKKAAEINPQDAAAHYNWGNALLYLQRFGQAIGHYRRALEIKPRSAAAHSNWATALINLGKVDQAIEHYRKAIEIDPTFAAAHISLDRALRKQGKFEEVIAHWQKAVAGAPSNVEIRIVLGNALAGQGKFDQAVAQFEKVLEMDSDNVTAIGNLARLLAACPKDHIRDGARAVKLAEQACKATQYEMPVLLDTLAAAYAEAGKFPQAVNTATKALRLAEPKQKSLAMQIRRRLELYKAGKRYRQRP